MKATLFSLALCVFPPVAMAQTTPLPEASLLLEMNSATDLPDEGCQLTMVSTNRLPHGLTRAAWQVAVFDSAGVVRYLPVLDFGALPMGKTKVAAFPLPGLSCTNISRIVVNDVAECRADDGTDLRDACLAALATQTRGHIDFGL
ncbi:MAG: hypothetical protein Q4G24_15095 [Paracoccus sp. (in: a-proteobacteria)]|uniref:hypothetical protein n=1 Tax=Paracoccus sp. TaxID=267 RepID=UPI0026DF9CCA|nr:hypothetical protein [Paracoccus sp. (in: a-proteobacteria)]MDO5622779.1 hypothetical protein [Paracoccus sp. (in: a-proteobacteria)]